jgi:WD40 repeat protein
MAAEGILQPWWTKIQQGDICAFVTSSGCEELAELVERANSAESWEEFDKEFLAAGDQQKRFTALMKAWSTPSRKDAYQALLKIKVHLIGEGDLAQWIEDRLKAIVDVSPASAAAVLAQLADDSCHRELTANAVRAHLTKNRIRIVTKTSREPAYLSVIRDLFDRTPKLIGRKAEIKSIKRFASGRSGYMWLIGAPWAGKTALSTHAVQTLALDVDCVAYFLQQRRSDADSKRFLGAVVPQLAWLLGEDPPDTPDATEFSALWERACERASAAERPLLLLVDGLDEDIRPRGLPSVASLLPTALRDFGHVLVTSRPNPALPDDVQADHPLRTTSPVALTQSPDARQIQERAITELGHLLRGNALSGKVRKKARRVLGSLAVARGALSVIDISEITDLQVAQVREVVSHGSARVLESIDSGTRFQFAHQALLESCNEILAEDRETSDLFLRLTQWADGWRKKEWPSTGTPTYLLSDYPFALIGYEAYDEASAVISDPTWVAASITVTGIDVAQSAIAAITQTGYNVNNVRRLVDCEIHHFSRRYPLTQPGYVARQLSLAALRVNASEEIQEQLIRYIKRNGPWLAARWTTRLVEPELIRTLGHIESEGVWAVAISPNGQTVFTADNDGVIAEWKTERAADPKILEAHDRVYSLALSDDGRYLAAGGREMVVKYELGSGESTLRMAPWVEAVAFAHHAQRMYGSGSTRREIIWEWDLDDSEPRDLSTSPAFSGSNWQEEDTEPAIALAISGDDRYLVAVGHRGIVSKWDLNAKSPSPVVMYRFEDAHAASFTPDARVGIVIDRARAVHVFSPLVRGRSRKITEIDTSVMGVALDDDGARAIALGDDGTIRVIQVQENPPLRTIGRHDERMTPADEVPSTDDWYPVGVAARSGLGVTVGRDQFLRLWSLHGPSQGTQSDDQSEELVVLGMSRHGRFVVSGSSNGSVALWETLTGAKETLLDPNGGMANFVALTPDERHIIAVGSDHEIRMWDRQQPQTPRVVGWNEDSNARYLLAADGRYLVSYTDVGEIYVWDVTEDAPPVTLGSGFSPIRAVDASTNGGLIVAVTLNRTLFSWKLGPNPRMKIIGTQSGPPMRCLAISQDERTVVTGRDDGTIQIWDLLRGTEPLVVGEPGGEPIRSIRICNQGRHVATLSAQGTVRVWPLAGLTSSYRLDQDGRMSHIFFAPNGEHLISTTAHGLQVWSLASRQEIARVSIENIQKVVVSTAVGSMGECEIAAYSPSLGLTSLRLTV